MNHLGDANKMVDTPMTDAEEKRQSDEYRCMSEVDWPSFPVDFDFARTLERELNAANERIKRLEEAGDAMFPWSERVGQEFWTKAKEAKL